MIDKKQRPLGMAGSALLPLKHAQCDAPGRCAGPLFAARSRNARRRRLSATRIFHVPGRMTPRPRGEITPSGGARLLASARILPAATSRGRVAQGLRSKGTRVLEFGYEVVRPAGMDAIPRHSVGQNDRRLLVDGTHHAMKVRCRHGEIAGAGGERRAHSPRSSSKPCP